MYIICFGGVDVETCLVNVSILSAFFCMFWQLVVLPRQHLGHEPINRLKIELLREDFTHDNTVKFADDDRYTIYFICWTIMISTECVICWIYIQ